MRQLQSLERTTFRIIRAATLFSIFVFGKEALGQAPANKQKTNPPAAAEKELAPAVEILPFTVAASAEICVRVTDRGGGISKVELEVNGSKIQPRDSTEVPQTGHECRWSFDVALIPDTNHLKALAYASNGAPSQPDVDTVVVPSPLANDTLHIFTVGINTYPGGDGAPPLAYAVNDARAFADSLRRQARRLFASVRVDSLYNRAATRSAIQSKFRQLASTVRRNHTFVFFYAGHGTVATVGSNRAFYLAPAGVSDLNDAKIVDSLGIHAAELQTWVSRIPAYAKLLVLDACRSGDLVTFFDDKLGPGPAVLGELSVSTRTTIFAATQASEESGRGYSARESSTVGHGLFTAGLLQTQRNPGEPPAIRQLTYLIATTRAALTKLYNKAGLKDAPLMQPPPIDFALVVR